MVQLFPRALKLSQLSWPSYWLAIYTAFVLHLGKRGSMKYGRLTTKLLRTSLLPQRLRKQISMVFSYELPVYRGRTAGRHILSVRYAGQRDYSNIAGQSANLQSRNLNFRRRHSAGTFEEKGERHS